MKKKQLGQHILVEFYNCDRDVINNRHLVEEHMNEAARAAKTTIVESVFHMFNPWGVSGAVIIQESHLTIHTWPEYGFASVDLYTCGETAETWKAFDYLKDALKAEDVEIAEVPRGIMKKIEERLTFIPKEEPERAV